MGTILFYITLAVILIVVLALVYFLVRIIVALRGASRSLYELADGLDTIARDTQPLPEKLSTINGALKELNNGLLAVDGHLAATARLLRY